MRLIAALTAIAIASFALWTSAAPAAPRRGRVSMNYRNTDLRQLLLRTGNRLGERFLFDANVTGRVTIAVPKPVSREEAIELLFAALELRGFAAVPLAPGGYKVVSLQDTGATARWGLDAPDALGESRLVTLVPIEHIPVDAVLGILTPLLDGATLRVSLPETNSLILGTTQRRLAGILQLIDELDQPDARALTVRTLRYRDAEEVRNIIGTTYGAREGAAAGVETWSDARTNTLIYRTGPSRAEAVRNFIDHLDTPARGGGQVTVIRLRSAEAATLAQHLEELTSPPTRSGPNAGPARGAGLSGLDVQVIADEPTNSLLVRGAPEDVGRVADIVEELDQPPRQIAVEVIALELTSNDAEVLDFKLRAASDKGVIVNPQQGPQPVHSLLLNVDDSGLPAEPGPGVGAGLVRITRGPIVAALIATTTSSESELLLNPTLIALAGEEHSLFVGNNIPIPRESSSTDQSTGPLQLNTTIDRTDTGVELRVRPTIGVTGHVVLELDVDITGIGPPLPGSDVQEVGVTLTQQRIQTTARLLDGEYLVIAGQTESVMEDLETGTPFLKDIPFIGFMFRATAERLRYRRLVVAARPHLISTDDERTAYTIRRRLAFERATERVAALEAPAGAPWALRVDTRSDERAARAIAASLDSELHPTRLIEWGDGSQRLFDVYVVGFEHFIDATQEAYQLETEGYETDVVRVDRFSEALQEADHH